MIEAPLPLFNEQGEWCGKSFTSLFPFSAKSFEPHKYGSLSVKLPDWLVKVVTDWQIEKVQDEHLATKGRELDLHITVLYGFADDPEQPDKIRGLLARQGPFEVRLDDKLSVFPDSGNGDVLKVNVISPVLDELNGLLRREFSIESDHPVYQAHLTLAYLKPETIRFYLDLDTPFLGMPFTAEDFEWSDKDNNREKIKLTILPQFKNWQERYQGASIEEYEDEQRQYKDMSYLNSNLGGALVPPPEFRGPKPKKRKSLTPPRAPGNGRSQANSTSRLGKSLTPPAIRNKEGYTGKREDALGRTQCYQEGEHVACNDADTPSPDDTDDATSEIEQETAQTDKGPVPVKRRAEKPKELVKATREGKGKDAKVVLANGQPAPAHITPAMIPPAWSKVKISMDPNADILVQGKMKDKKGKWVNKTVYHPKYLANNQAAKFAKIQEGLKKSKVMYEENQKNRSKPELKEMADVVWLMQEQATRPGSEADTKGLAKFYDQPFGDENIEVTSNTVTKGKNKGKTTYKVALKFDVDGKKVRIPVRDPGTAEQLRMRKESGKGLEDARYWLQSFGATTLEDRHVIEDSDGVSLQFVGKEGVFHNHRIRNPELAKMLVERKKSAKQREGKLFDTDYSQLNQYTRTLDGGDFSPKDFRTMKATEMAITAIAKKGPCCKSADEYKEAVMEVATQVSKVLGNKAAQALESYISPVVWSQWRNPDEGN